jgi:hypothetical protein
MKLNKTLLAIIFALSASYSLAQSKTPAVSPNLTPPAPGNIKLLPGYIHERKQGMDSIVGQISKKDGFVIYYDIGRMAANYAAAAYTDKKQNVLWVKNQKINNDDLMIVYLKDGTVYASFGGASANFIATVKTNEELTEFLLMVLTYDGSEQRSK